MIINKKNIACLLLNLNKKFLLVQRTSKDDSLPGFWELPSGGIDEGESMEVSVVREVGEEAGIDISDSDKRIVDSESYSFKKENGDVKNVTETTFLVSFNNTPEVILSNEHVNYQWVSLAELDNVFKDREDLIYKRIHRVFHKEGL